MPANAMNSGVVEQVRLTITIAEPAAASAQAMPINRLINIPRPNHHHKEDSR